MVKQQLHSSNIGFPVVPMLVDGIDTAHKRERSPWRGGVNKNNMRARVSGGVSKDSHEINSQESTYKLKVIQTDDQDS